MRGESVLFMYTICNICKLCKNAIYVQCPGNHKGDGVGDGSWCRHVNDEAVELLRRVSKNAKNSRDSAYGTCGTVSIIELRNHIEHRAHSLRCCEPCSASNRSTAVEILDRLAAIDSLCCSDEPGPVYLHCKDYINVAHMRACC